MRNHTATVRLKKNQVTTDGDWFCGHFFGDQGLDYCVVFSKKHSANKAKLLELLVEHDDIRVDFEWGGMSDKAGSISLEAHQAACVECDAHLLSLEFELENCDSRFAIRLPKTRRQEMPNLLITQDPCTISFSAWKEDKN